MENILSGEDYREDIMDRMWIENTWIALLEYWAE